MTTQDRPLVADVPMAGETHGLVEREYACAQCGYFLFETAVTVGTIRVICKRCRKGQRVDLSRPPKTATRPNEILQRSRRWPAA